MNGWRWLDISQLSPAGKPLLYLDALPSSISGGFQAIHRKLLGLLEARGITPFSSIGQVFDPTLHEAVGSVRSDKYETGQVADEVQRGYRMGDELLRAARVRVAA